MDMNIWTESILERDLIHHLEYDSNVISYRTQAVRIFFELDGKRRHYTADVLCERRVGRPQIIEVKPKKRLSPWFLQLYRIITPICEREGFEFVLYTEFEIRIQPFLDNIKCLWKYARTPLYPSHQILCYEFFSSRQEAPLGKLFEFFVMPTSGETSCSCPSLPQNSFDRSTQFHLDQIVLFATNPAQPRPMRRHHNVRPTTTRRNAFKTCWAGILT